MADSTTEIDLDSVIDRLLEGLSSLLPLSPLSLPASPGKHLQGGWGGLCVGPRLFGSPLTPRGRPMPGIRRLVGNRLVAATSLQDSQLKGTTRCLPR